MICPHCQRTIAEQDQYLMSKRVSKDEALPSHMRLLGTVGLVIIAALVFGFLLHVTHFSV